MSERFEGVREFPQGTRTAAEAAGAISCEVGQICTSLVETVVDEDLPVDDVVWAAAGTPTRVFALTPARLREATGGRTVRVASP